MIILQRRLLLAALLGLIVIAMQGQKDHSTREQTAFSEQYPILHPIPLPPKVLTLLLKTEEGKQGLERATDSEKKEPTQLFRAARVHLRAPEESDLVIKGTGAMSGADNDWFWIVLSAQKNPRIALFAGGSLLEVMPSRTNGYRDIRSDWSNPNGTQPRIYRFNGDRYRLWKESWREHR